LSSYDTIVIGAGHNGLVTAGYLSRGGQRVLVLESNEIVGGLGRAREFHPGFSASVAHSVSHFSAKVADDLDLKSHGLSFAGDPLVTAGLGSDGEHVMIRNGRVSGVSEKDASAFQDYRQLMQRFAGALSPFWMKTMPRIGATGLADIVTFGRMGLKLRALGKRDMGEFMRVATLPVRDLMDENFDSDLLKTTLGWDGMIGAKLAMLYRIAGETEGAHRIPSGGVAGITDALRQSVEASGAEVRCNAPVARILIDGNADGLVATGVQLSDGEKVMAKRVISSIDPKRTFLNLVGVENLDIGFTNRIRRLRCEGFVGKLHLALDGVPEFTGLDAADTRMIMAPDLDAIEFAFDDAKYGESSSNPVLEAVVPSLQDDSLAPRGQHVLSAHVMYVPRELKGGWTDDARTAIRERAIDVLAKYAPGIRSQIIHSEFLTPADLERDYSVTGGHWHQTEFAVDQMLMMRPTYEAAQYSTPVPGLYLCGAGSHPGGDITGFAGHNAAKEILR
jgi:phytoene dehydrogenase-like protein